MFLPHLRTGAAKHIGVMVLNHFSPLPNSGVDWISIFRQPKFNWSFSTNSDTFRRKHEKNFMQHCGHDLSTFWHRSMKFQALFLRSQIWLQIQPSVPSFCFVPTPLEQLTHKVEENAGTNVCGFVATSGTV